MIGAVGVLREPGGEAMRAWRAPVALLVLLGAIMAARWVAVRQGGDGLLVGVLFGLALLGLATVGPRRLVARARRAASGRWSKGLVIGAVAGLALIAAAIAGPSIVHQPLIPGLGRPAAPFLPWASITIVVAVAEELVLRGVLFRSVNRVGGVAAAVAVTSLAFALMHVPLYGWHVVPLDLAVGLVLGGLRVATRTVAAPAAAHTVADLATWWL